MKKSNVKRQSSCRGRMAAVLGLFAAAALCTGCGSDGVKSFDMNASVTDSSYEGSSYNSSDSSGYVGAGYEYESGMETADSMTDAGTAASAQQKLIRNVNLSVETKEFDQVMSALNTQIRQLGGYIENMETYNGSQYSSYRRDRYANMTIRIPKTQLDGFLETVSGICNVVRQNESVEDVTLSYVDMESRRNTLRTEQERLLSFLEQAQTIEEIITIEDRLSNVRYQLESMEAQLRTIDNRVDYSTVYLDISEVKDLTPVVEQTAWERIISGFAESMRDIGDGAVEFFIWFAVNLPYFIIWAVIITAAVLIIKKLRRRRTLKKAALKEAQGAQTDGKQNSRQG